MSKKNIFIAGHNGMVGSAILRKLQYRDDVEVVFKNRNELDLLNLTAVQHFF